MQNIFWKIGLIILVIGGCALAINPPSKNIRLGRDLSGGVSLIYSVRMPEGTTDRQRVLAQTIDVLKDRVNPQGVLDISMTPQGNERIEIVMPLPNEEVQALSKAWKEGLDALMAATEIRAADLDEALRAGAAATTFSSDPSSDRTASLHQLQTAYTTFQRDLANYEEAITQGADDASRAAFEQAVADSELTYERQYDVMLSQSLDRGRVLRSLGMETEQPPVRNADGTVVTDEAGEPVLGRSPRQIALASMVSDFPSAASSITDVIAAYDAYRVKRTGFDDPEDLIRLLKGAGVLEFRIAAKGGQVQGVNVAELQTQLLERGPENTDSSIAKWFKINDPAQWVSSIEQLPVYEANPAAYLATQGYVGAVYEGEGYMLLYIDDARSMTHEDGNEWTLEAAYPTVDQLGRPAVGFGLDPAGGTEMARLTQPHVNEPMAIVLDGQVYTAPNINQQISDSGIIQGNFAGAEIDYMIRVLAAGALEARLSPEPIAVNILGPTLGAQNLEKGLEALWIAVIAVAIFMIGYYFLAGLVADMALLANGIIIFGVMAMLQGTFTLPGLAGVVLTMGMAVDANVLIYERIREELAGDARDLREAIREGYRRAFGTILDANLTNLIVCVVLLLTKPSTEIKGFALTLTIGIIATLFTSLFVTRIFYTIYTEVLGRKSLPMLPMVVPAIGRALHPAIDWVSLRGIFWVLSSVGIIGSVWAIWSRGVDILDTEFRGGVAVTMQTRLTDLDDPDSPRLTFAQSGEASVQERVWALAAGGSSDPEASATERVLVELGNASVLTVGEATIGEDGRVWADSFQIKVANPVGLEDEQAITGVVVDALVEEFGGDLDVVQPLEFLGMDSDDWASYTIAIEDKSLGDVLNDRSLHDDLTGFMGGVLMKVEEISPPASPDDIAARIDLMRQDPLFARDTAGRDVQVIGLEISPDGTGYTSVAIAVLDRDINYFKTADAAVVDDRVAAREWELVRSALVRKTSLQQVSSFSASMAQTRSANAWAAIILSLLGILAYIWIRFGSLRYSAAAIIALLHDVTLTLGALAVTGYLAGNAFFSQTMMIGEFRIDLGVVAALLTVIGYSLNDTIVILDRIRENRGRLPFPTKAIVNESINQTISRTVLTSVTTLLAVLIIFVEGGMGIRPFAYCLFIGILVGTYSSVAIASPIVFKRGGGVPEPVAEDGETALETETVESH